MELCNWPEAGARAARGVASGSEGGRRQWLGRAERAHARARDEIPIRENYCNGCAAAANSNAARKAGYAAATFPIFRSAAVPTPSLHR